jgi:hypothetical protein
MDKEHIIREIRRTANASVPVHRSRRRAVRLSGRVAVHDAVLIHRRGASRRHGKARGNRAIHRHATDGRELHLFEKTDRSGYYRYVGQFRYVSHQLRRGSDVDGDERNQIVFTLELVEPATPGATQ